jgi:hypothetical protein
MPLSIPRAQRTESHYVPVMAPADAQIIEISTLGSSTSIRIVMAHGCETFSILMVLNRLAGSLAYLHDDLMMRGSLNPNIRVPAGSILGEQRDNPLDFSVHDGAAWLSGYEAPFSYAEGEALKPYTVDPWPYFTPDLAAFYESRMQRLDAPRWGRIDLDERGTAAGSWFLDGTFGMSGRPRSDFLTNTPLRGGPIPGKLTPSWSHLALVPHPVQPSRWMLSIGWWRDERGDATQALIDLLPEQLSPAQLTPGSGAVYRLRNYVSSGQAAGGSFAPAPIGYELLPLGLKGIVAVAMNADGSLTIEVVPSVNGELPEFTQFTEAHRIYRR